MPSLEPVVSIGDGFDLSNTANFGLSKHLSIPITVKICYLQPNTKNPPKVAPNSQKYRHPEVFQKLSNISINSDLFVRIQVFDSNNNPVCTAVQTPYKAFSGNKRVWNSYVKLPINYNQVGYSDRLRFTICEVVGTSSCVFGVGELSLFNHTNSTLRKGSYKIPIGHDIRPVIYGNINGTTEIENSLVKYENGDYAHVPWLDTIAMPIVDKLRDTDVPTSNADSASEDDPYYFYLELPNFQLPIVYLDVSYEQSLAVPVSSLGLPAPETEPTTASTMVINSIDIPTTNSKDKADIPRIYDPDFHKSTLRIFNSAEESDEGPILLTGASAVHDVDPIEKKFQMLSTNINNNSFVDREVKPSPHVRDELWNILKMPSSAILTDHQKKLLWKYRFYFSKNSLSDDSGSVAAPLQTTRHFLTKFLKCFNWENEFELDQAFTEILPNWTADKIEIGDALELLSNNFNPNNLAATLRRRIIATNNSTTKDINTAEEKKIDKIFECARKLRTFAVDRLRTASADELLLYLLQLVQALKYESFHPRDSDPLRDAPLAKFLIERSVESGKLGNFFYWYVKVENEDQLNKNENNGDAPQSVFGVVLNTYIDKLKENKNRLPQYKYLKRQIAFIKKLTVLVHLLRSSFKKNEATAKKVQFLQDYLADSSNEMLKFPEPFPLPLDPSVIICGCYPSESSVFKSSMAPLKITFKTITNYNESSSSSTNMFGTKKNKYGKYALMFKIGDDLRQDQLVIQIITLMDQLLKNENLNLKLTPYKILATSPNAGLIQFVPNETLDSVLSKTYIEAGTSNQEANVASGANGVNGNGILSYLKLHSRITLQEEPEAESVLGKKKASIPTQQQQKAISTDLGVSDVLMDNYVKSCAGYCVITYLLGVGDRHLDNLLISPNGKFWHADFGYILGRDPKPLPPLMKLPIQVIDGMGGMNHENFNIFKSYCFITYTTLRRNSNLILNLFQLMLNANIPDIQVDRNRAVEKVQDKFALEMTEEEAILHFQSLIIDSVNAFLPVVIDALHSLAQYWRA